MKLTLDLMNVASDDQRMSEELMHDFDIKSNIYVYKSEEMWDESNNTHCYSLWLEYGRDSKKTLMFEVDLNDLEMFASSILKSIDIFRRDYDDVIKRKIKKGECL